MSWTADVQRVPRAGGTLVALRLSARPVNQLYRADIYDANNIRELSEPINCNREAPGVAPEFPFIVTSIVKTHWSAMRL